jgi:hypothetical protein
MVLEDYDEDMLKIGDLVRFTLLSLSTKGRKKPYPIYGKILRFKKGLVYINPLKVYTYNQLPCDGETAVEVVTVRKRNEVHKPGIEEFI